MILESLEARIERVPFDTCWHWTGTLRPDGYGVFFVGKSPKRAHRLVYEQTVGPIPVGLELDHLCRVRSCVNPAHLEPVTRRINLLRGIGLPAQEVAQTHCKAGHLFNASNTRVRVFHGREMRQCRACDRIRHQRARQP